MTVADRIKARREEMGMTQEDLALAIGRKDKTTISKIEKSGDKISLKNLEKIAKPLHTTVTYLRGFEDEVKSVDRKIATDYNAVLSESINTRKIVELCKGEDEDNIEAAFKMLKIFFKALER